MQAGGQRGGLIKDRDYLRDRLSEISLELGRLGAEAIDLKQEMERAAAPAGDRIKQIRRRRFYLGRRSDELKVERQRVATERDRVSSELETAK
jgi:hypothetical protein